MTATDLFNSLRRFSDIADAFAAGVRAKIEARLGSSGPPFAGRPGPVAHADQSERFKDLLANAAVFDQELLTRTPANPSWRCELAGRWPGRLLRRRTRLVAVVAVDLAEVVRRAKESASASPWPPLSAEALDEALRDFRVAPPRTFVGVCSPSGFTDGAADLARQRAEALARRGGGLVLVTPRADGGWIVRPADSPATGGAADPNVLAEPWQFLFDPEPVDEKIERVRKAIAAAAADLAEVGLNDRRLANRLDLPLALVRQVFAAEAGSRPGLRVRELDGDQVLLGPAHFATGLIEGPREGSQEGRAELSQEKTMSMLQKLRELLGLKGQEARKIELLADKRALLATRRDWLFGELDELGEREKSLRDRGIAADSPAMQRRLASELASVRRRIEQGSAVASLLSRQIDVLSTHIHHLTLLTQGQAVEMPGVEEMTRDAVRAEELIERVKGDADLAESLADATGASLTSKQEAEIMAEFAAGRAEGKAAPGAEKSAEGVRR